MSRPGAPKPMNPTDLSPHLRLPNIEDKYNLDLSDVGLKGTGGFSRVVVGECRETHQLRAIKIVKKSELNTRKKMEVISHEKETLRRLHHPNVIRLYEVIETETSICFVLELMKTDLYHYVRECKSLTERDAAVVMKGVFSAVAHLHEHNIVHRDIKPGNILLNTPEDVRLADFGLAKMISNGQTNVANTPCGTASYMAPEIIKGIQRDGPTPLITTSTAIKYVDIWSCGIVLYMLLCGRLPFRGTISTPQNCREMLQKMDRGVLFPNSEWDDISEDAKSLISDLLNCNPTHRITAVEALEHPFIKNATAQKVTPLPTPAVLAGTAPEDFQREVDNVHEVNMQANDDEGVPSGEAPQVVPYNPAHVDGSKPVVMKPALFDRRKNNNNSNGTQQQHS